MKPAHNLVDTAMTTAVRNGLKIAGFDVYRVHFDRPLTPDAQEHLVELWQAGATVDEICADMNLSEARASGELLYLELKGQIGGFVREIREG